MKRILIKISWEALWQKNDKQLDQSKIKFIAEKIKNLRNQSQIIIVIGWGNIFRWNDLALLGLDKVTSDYIWMLATIMNWIALWSELERIWVDNRVMSAIEMPKIAEYYIPKRAIKHLNKNRVVICVWWTWNPYVSTDTAAVLRALELKCDYMVKATKVDWLYDKDPLLNTDAKRYDVIDTKQALINWYKILDYSAYSLAMKEWLNIYVTHYEKLDSIENIEKWTLIFSK